MAVIGVGVLHRFHKDDENNFSLIKEKHQSTKFIEIENEVSARRTQLLSDLMFDSKCMSTVQFWKKHRERLPNLLKLSKVLLNIQASSAFENAILASVVMFAQSII